MTDLIATVAVAQRRLLEAAAEVGGTGPAPARAMRQIDLAEQVLEAAKGAVTLGRDDAARLYAALAGLLSAVANDQLHDEEVV